MALSNIIKQAVRSIIRWASRDEKQKISEDSIPYHHSNVTTRSAPGNFSDRGLNFTIYPATGGKVVQLSYYDPRTDRQNNTLYIINDKDDLGEELGLIITKESLTR